MHPQIHLNCAAIGVSVVAAFFFGFLYHGPLFGKLWAKEMGYDCNEKPDSKGMIRGLILTIIGTFLTAFVLAHSTEIWRPSVWNAGQDSPGYVYGFFAGFFTWLGFYVPHHLNGVAWERKNWKVTAINALYSFLDLQLIGQILANWR